MRLRPLRIPPSRSSRADPFTSPQTFVERTFQRTLVELNKLISFSGTPTVVWRRTGEICLVGTEFCLLTGWKREELVGKKYIFEVRPPTTLYLSLSLSLAFLLRWHC